MTDLEGFEREMHALFAAAECEALAQEMSAGNDTAPRRIWA
ncbi:MAG TPA: hypothetical protein VFR85_07935 [Anaeromyxobacteraceae bacterium]|nr:hypothetical protein [Anaeromyxobacteraceae bacterium]